MSKNSTNDECIVVYGMHIAGIEGGKPREQATVTSVPGKLTIGVAGRTIDLFDSEILSVTIPTDVEVHRGLFKKKKTVWYMSITYNREETCHCIFIRLDGVSTEANAIASRHNQ